MNKSYSGIVHDLRFNQSSSKTKNRVKLSFKDINFTVDIPCTDAESKLMGGSTTKPLSIIKGATGYALPG